MALLHCQPDEGASQVEHATTLRGPSDPRLIVTLGQLSRLPAPDRNECIRRTLIRRPRGDSLVAVGIVACASGREMNAIVSRHGVGGRAIALLGVERTFNKDRSGRGFTRVVACLFPSGGSLVPVPLARR